MTEAPPTLQRIPLIQRVIIFAARNPEAADALATVHSTWHETVFDFGTADIVCAKYVHATATTTTNGKSKKEEQGQTTLEGSTAFAKWYWRVGLQTCSPEMVKRATRLLFGTSLLLDGGDQQNTQSNGAATDDDGRGGGGGGGGGDQTMSRLIDRFFKNLLAVTDAHRTSTTTTGSAAAFTPASLWANSWYGVGGDSVFHLAARNNNNNNSGHNKTRNHHNHRCPVGVYLFVCQIYLKLIYDKASSPTQRALAVDSTLVRFSSLGYTVLQTAIAAGSVDLLRTVLVERWTKNNMMSLPTYSTNEFVLGFFPEFPLRPKTYQRSFHEHQRESITFRLRQQQQLRAACAGDDSTSPPEETSIRLTPANFKRAPAPFVLACGGGGSNHSNNDDYDEAAAEIVRLLLSFCSKYHPQHRRLQCELHVFDPRSPGDGPLKMAARRGNHRVVRAIMDHFSSAGSSSWSEQQEQQQQAGQSRKATTTRTMMTLAASRNILDHLTFGKPQRKVRLGPRQHVRYSRGIRFSDHRDFVTATRRPPYGCETALHLAVALKQVEVARQLLALAPSSQAGGMTTMMCYSAYAIEKTTTLRPRNTGKNYMVRRRWTPLHMCVTLMTNAHVLRPRFSSRELSTAVSNSTKNATKEAEDGEMFMTLARLLIDHHRVHQKREEEEKSRAAAAAAVAATSGDEKYQQQQFNCDDKIPPCSMSLLLDAQTNRGWTPLHAAALASSRRHSGGRPNVCSRARDFAKLLIEAGCNKNKRTIRSFRRFMERFTPITALQVAEQRVNATTPVDEESRMMAALLRSLGCET